MKLSARSCYFLVPLILLLSLHIACTKKPKGHSAAQAKKEHKNQTFGRMFKRLRHGRSVPDVVDKSSKAKAPDKSPEGSASANAKLASSSSGDFIHIPVQQLAELLRFGGDDGRASESEEEPELSENTGENMFRKDRKNQKGFFKEVTTIQVNGTGSETIVDDDDTVDDRANEEDLKNDPSLSIVHITNIDQHTVFIKPTAPSDRPNFTIDPNLRFTVNPPVNPPITETSKPVIFPLVIASSTSPLILPLLKPSSSASTTTVKPTMNPHWRIFTTDNLRPIDPAVRPLPLPPSSPSSTTTPKSPSPPSSPTTSKSILNHIWGEMKKMGNKTISAMEKVGNETMSAVQKVGIQTISAMQKVGKELSVPVLKLANKNSPSSTKATPVHAQVVSIPSPFPEHLVPIPSPVPPVQVVPVQPLVPVQVVPILPPKTVSNVSDDKDPSKQNNSPCASTTSPPLPPPPLLLLPNITTKYPPFPQLHQHLNMTGGPIIPITGIIEDKQTQTPTVSNNMTSLSLGHNHTTVEVPSRKPGFEVTVNEGKLTLAPKTDPYEFNPGIPLNMTLNSEGHRKKKTKDKVPDDYQD